MFIDPAKRARARRRTALSWVARTAVPGILAAAAVALPSDRSAAEQAVANASVEVLLPLTVEKINDLRFGTVALNNSGLDGTLTVRFVDGFAPLPGDRFPLVVGQSVTGEFNVVDVPARYDYEIVYGDQTVELVITGETAVDNRRPRR